MLAQMTTSMNLCLLISKMKISLAERIIITEQNNACFPTQFLTLVIQNASDTI